MRCLRLYHPSSEIRCVLSDELRGKLIALGVSYSSAIYRSIDVARYLLRFCADVQTLMTPRAARAISPQLFHWATGRRPITRLTGDVEHIALARQADAMVIAPATLRTVTAIAMGYAVNSVVATAIAMRSQGKPVVIAPAMHRDLLLSRQARESMARLYDMGYYLLPPLEKDGRVVLPDPYYIARKVVSVSLRGEDLRNLRIVVTAGATREFIDDVRFISNPSSGRMGMAIALEAMFRGASTTLVAGHLEAEPPPWIYIERVTSTDEMCRVLMKTVEKKKPHALIMAAAPADFKPSERVKGKIDSRVAELTLKLIPTPKILRELRKVYNGVVIGFAAEVVESSEELIEKARRKLEEYELDAIVANPVGIPGIGFASPMNEVYICTPNGRVKHVGPVLKEVIAREVIDIAKELISRRLGISL